MQLQHGVGIGKCGRLICGYHQKRVRRDRHMPSRCIYAGTKIEQHCVVAEAPYRTNRLELHA